MSEHTIGPTLTKHGPGARFACFEDDDAWCRSDANEGEPPPDDPTDCWFTVLASGFDPWGLYDGPLPVTLRAGAIEFVRHDRREVGHDYCTWHYIGDSGGQR